MSSKKSTFAIISGSGSYIPPVILKNSDFEDSIFMNEDGSKIDIPGKEIVQKFKQITEIEERRIAKPEHTTSDMGTFAATDAIETSGIDPEELDYIIFAHNLGDIKSGSNTSNILPTLASRVKYNLKIKNHKTVAYDITFGCPGWTQAMIQANIYIKAGEAKKILVIGADTITRSMDPHDRDTMIFGDGAGATIVEAVESEKPVGILKHVTRTDTQDYMDLLQMGESFNKEKKGSFHLKMQGRRLYNYALTNVPPLAKECLELNNMTLSDIKKVLIHQANAKMDEAILTRLFRLYGIKKADLSVMPMTINTLGNSSVATVPTLYDLIIKGKMEGHELNPGDNIVMTSVGAGMNINAFVYKIPE
ncbi:ketoacyl-ACP synthase III [Marinilabiliaceae bacterium ANBcel2]|nr:ketoacyl-ACP synthase III [Marinilabiliaceae bacterium ANBcel2]